jgi:hypothetical protein
LQDLWQVFCGEPFCGTGKENESLPCYLCLALLGRSVRVHPQLSLGTGGRRKRTKEKGEREIPTLSLADVLLCIRNHNKYHTIPLKERVTVRRCDTLGSLGIASKPLICNALPGLVRDFFDHIQLNRQKLFYEVPNSLSLLHNITA